MSFGGIIFTATTSGCTLKKVLKSTYTYTYIYTDVYGCGPRPFTVCFYHESRISKCCSWVVFITCDSEMIMFSPGVFVCVSVCICLSRCLSGRFNHEGLVPHKQYVHQILKLLYISINISARTSIKSSKYRKWSWLYCWYVQLLVSLPVKISQPQNGGHFENFEVLNTDSICPQLWKDRPKLCQKEYFSWWWRHRWRPRMASNSARYISLYIK